MILRTVVGGTTYDHALTTGSGGLTAVAFFAPMTGSVAAMPTIVSLTDPAGTAVVSGDVAKHVRIESQVRCAFAKPSNYQGPTGLWYRERTVAVENVESRAGSYASLGTPILSARLKRESTYGIGFEWQIASPSLGAVTAQTTPLLSSSVVAEINGEPVDYTDALNTSTPLGGGAGSDSGVPSTTTTTTTATTRVTETVFTGLSSGFTSAAVPGGEREFFPIGWSGAQDTAHDWSGNVLTSVQAPDMDTPATVTPFTVAMVREARAAPFAETLHRTPWRSLAVTDPGVVLCVTTGWAEWSAP